MRNRNGISMSLALFSLAIAAVFGATLVLAADSASDTFSASLVLGNTAPVINSVTVGNGGTYNPTSGSVTAISVAIDVTDEDGWKDINLSATYCNVSKGSTVVNLSCTNISNSSATTVTLNCTGGNMQYYYLSGSDWVVNCTVVDNSSASDNDDTQTLTYNRLESVDVTPASISWSSVSQTSTNVGADDDPVTVENLGNAYFANLNITAYELVGTTDATDKIAASDFSANDVDASEGEQLANDTAVTVAGTSLLIGQGSTEDVYVYLEQISSLVSPQTYNSAQNWVLTVYNAGNQNP